MARALGLGLRRWVLAAVAVGWAFPATAEAREQSLADYLAEEERRLCALSAAADSTQAEIAAALTDLDRMVRAAEGEVRFLEMETVWLVAGIARTFSDLYQEVHADEIGFADTAKLGGAAASLSLVVSANQPFYDRLYGRLQSDDPTDEELEQARLVAQAVGDATKILGAALLEVLQIPLSSVKQGPSAAFDLLLEKLDRETAGRVMEARALDIGLVATYRDELAAARSALSAVGAFRERARICLDAWPPAAAADATEPVAAGASCLPKADLWFMHADPQCGDPKDRFKMKIVTGDGDVVEYVEGCAKATYSLKSFTDIQLSIRFSSASLGSDKDFLQPDGSFEGRLQVQAFDGAPTGFVIGYRAALPCGDDGLPSAFRFSCFAPNPDWAKADLFYAAFGAAATVSCSHSIPRDKNNFKWNE